MEHKRAMKIADILLERLYPACERMEIAGSLRRGKADVKDIEIVAIPDMTPVPAPKPKLEFGKPIPRLTGYKTQLDALLADASMNGFLEFEKNGDKFKKLVYFEGSTPVIKIDLFLVTPPARWGVQFLIRTGPADFSHWAVTRRKTGGALPNGYRVQDGAVWRGEHENETQNLIGFDSELEFIEFLGLDWIDPAKRVAVWTK